MVKARRVPIDVGREAVDRRGGWTAPVKHRRRASDVHGANTRRGDVNLHVKRISVSNYHTLCNREVNEEEDKGPFGAFDRFERE